MILTSTQSPGSWAEVFGDRVIATAILDRILHHAITVNIRGNSYRLKEKLKGRPRPPRRGHGVNPGVGNFQLPRLGRFGLPLTLRAPRVDESVCRLGGRDRPRPRRMCGAPHRGRRLGLSEARGASLPRAATPHHSRQLVDPLHDCGPGLAGATPPRAVALHAEGGALSSGISSATSTSGTLIPRPSSGRESRPTSSRRPCGTLINMTSRTEHSWVAALPSSDSTDLCAMICTHHPSAFQTL